MIASDGFGNFLVFLGGCRRIRKVVGRSFFQYLLVHDLSGRRMTSRTRTKAGAGTPKWRR